MKIFYITASFPFGIGESFLIPEIEALKNEGVELSIIPIFPRGKLRGDWENISSNYTLYAQGILSLRILFYLLKFLCLHPIIFYTLLMLLKGSTSSQLIKNLAILPKSIWLKSLIEKEKPEHIHAHWGSTTSTAAMLAAYGSSISWSLTCHRWDIYENNLLQRKSENSRFIRFISAKGKTDAIKLGVLSERSFVIPMGTKIPGIPNYPIWENNGAIFTIICPANLIPVKGHIYLIEAMNKLIQQGYKIKLLLAGEGILKKELQAVIIEKGIKDNVIFLGQLTHNDLLAYYADASIHLMVLPSVDLGNGEHEGVPVSLMEAMSYGVPVISTETGSINELLLKEYELTVPDKNANALTEKIKLIYNNPGEYIKTAKLCRKIIEVDWDVSTSTKKIFSMISNIQNTTK